MYSIICLGNILMADDSIGVVLGYLLQKKGINKDIYICETDIGVLQDALDKSSEILLLDAIDMGIDPGDYRIIPLSDIKYSYFLPHELLVDFNNKPGYLFGVQVSEIHFEKKLSRTLQNNLKVYLNQIASLVK